MSSSASHKQTGDFLEFSAQAELFDIERCLKNYNADIIHKITRGILAANPSLSKHSLSQLNVLEFGAGIGALAQEYTVQNGKKPDCVEIDPVQSQILVKRGFECFNSLQNRHHQYDVIYTSNVLEHIEDDQLSIKDLYDCLKPGAALAIYVPAFMCLWTKMDELVGHYRRYTKPELMKKVSAAGFHVFDSYYVDSVGFFATLYLRMKGYKKGDAIFSDKSLKFFDKILYPISQFLDWMGCRFFLGKSLLLIAVKPRN